MNLESSAFHVLGAFGRAIGRVILWFFILLIVGFGAIQGVAAATNHLGLFSYIGGAVVGLVLGYAAGLTVIVGEVVRILVGVVHELQAIVKDGETDVGSIVGRLEGVISGSKKK